MASFKALCLAGVVALAATATTAHAADLLPPPPPVEAPYIPPAPVGGGWYLRGDVGAADLQLDSRQTTFGRPAGIAGNGFNVVSSALTETATVGGGVGYQVNSYIRGDITGEYRFGSDYSAVETTLKGCGAGAAFGCADSYGAKVSSGVVLANGYLDLGTYYRVTPYVGAGVGAAFNEFGGLTDYNLTFRNGYPSGFGQSHTNIALAWALMAGISYDLTQNLKLDIGYRYLDMGKLMSSPIVCSNGGCPYETQSYKLYSHDVRIGLRYAFADAIPYAPRIPLATRY